MECLDRQSKFRAMVRSQGAYIETGLSIGASASQGGVNVETIRYHQRRNLLREPRKPGAGRRRYPAGFVQRVRFIKRAQALGFTLDKIASMLKLDELRACSLTYALACRKLADIDAKLVDLRAMKKVLTQLAGQCVPLTAGARPIIDALAQD